jgi:hypothetical protein
MAVVQNPLPYGSLLLANSSAGTGWQDFVTAFPGEEILVSITPLNSNYRLDRAYMMYNASTVDVPSPYTFSMPEANVVVSADFTLKPGVVEYLTAPQPPLPTAPNSPTGSTAEGGGWKLSYPNGTAYVSPQKLIPGPGITAALSVSPAADFRLKAITVIPANAGPALPLSPAVSSGTLDYTFVMPASHIADIQIAFERVYPVTAVGAPTGIGFTLDRTLAADTREEIILSLWPNVLLGAVDPVKVNNVSLPPGDITPLGGGQYRIKLPSLGMGETGFAVEAAVIHARTITLSPASGGSIAAALNGVPQAGPPPASFAALSGDEITLTVSPHAGKKLAEFLVDGVAVVSGGTVNASNAAGVAMQGGGLSGVSVWKFAMPDRNVAVSAVFVDDGAYGGGGIISVYFENGQGDETFTLSGPGGAPLSLDSFISVGINGSGWTVLSWLLDAVDKTADIRAVLGGSPASINAFTVRLRDLGWDLRPGTWHSLTAVVYPGSTPPGDGPNTGIAVYSKTIRFNIQH